MKLIVEPYSTQSARLPKNGRHILAQFDDDAIVVYQAFRPEIGHWAVNHGRFGGVFSFGRMSWIKTSFLWMMYRSGWGTKPGQEATLAIWVKRAGFEAIVAEAVPSTFDATHYQEEAVWAAAVARSDVRLQWDPDRAPDGRPLQRRAIQLGLRGQKLVQYANEWIINIENISQFVREQAGHIRSPEDGQSLLVPRVEIYRPIGEEPDPGIGPCQAG